MYSQELTMLNLVSIAFSLVVIAVSSYQIYDTLTPPDTKTECIDRGYSSMYDAKGEGPAFCNMHDGAGYFEVDNK